MPANEFEKQVQGKMNELGLDPSASVWLEVERRIRPEKKRRIIFWFPLLVLGTGLAIGAIILTRNQQPKKFSNTEVKMPVTNKTESAPVILPTENLTPKTEQQNTIHELPSHDKTITKINKNPNWQKNFISSPTQMEDKVQVPIVTDTEKKPTVLQTDPPVEKRLTDVAVEKEETKEVSKELIDSTKIIQDTNSTVVSPVETKEQEKPDLTKKINQRKWKWGLLLQVGSSAIVESAHFFNRQTDAANFASPNSSTGGPAFSPGVTYPGGSFGAGIFMQRAISKSTGIRINFQYSMLSTKMSVGSRVDSSKVIANSSSQGLLIDNFYRASTADSVRPQAYKNRYHMIGLTADFSWSITKGKKFSLSWENSLGYYLMFSSNALYFDWNILGYYEDPKLTKKSQLFLSTGLSAPVSANFIINLFAEYGLGTVLKKGPVATHFTNFGIRARYFPFHKK